ncbi:hypothetical protein O181_013752 [Austropuccinia psidii MF-1]|uniref:MIF4G domain-containing protein n=1 Tax=Austropuccinia psidii MF-1 TaxID=1389203 RepID=A0A9Q3BYX8_9BASI|nr:hypothetical protein [Austropuccinia psidii MF-1]
MQLLPTKPSAPSSCLMHLAPKSETKRDFNRDWRSRDPVPKLDSLAPLRWTPTGIEILSTVPNHESSVPMASMEKLIISENAWTPARKNASSNDTHRKVRALLNKLTPENFDSVSQKILDLLILMDDVDNTISNIKGAIKLIFEKAIDEAQYSSLYTRLAIFLQQKFPLDISDKNVLNSHGKALKGPELFRKYLVENCQEAFQIRFSKNNNLVPKDGDDESTSSTQPELLSDEYYAEKKERRQWLGLVKFIGELFKMKLLAELVVNICFEKLLRNIDNPEEDFIEATCQLATTVGPALDRGDQGSVEFDAYLRRMAQMIDNPNISSRSRFMLMDIIDARKEGWKDAKRSNGPKKLSDFHQQAVQPINIWMKNKTIPESK